MAGWETWAHNTITGEPIERLWPADASWSTSLLGDGDGTFTFRTDDAERPFTRERIDATLRPNACTIVHRWGSFVAFAGKVDDWAWSENGSLVARAVELRNEFDWRMTYGVSVYTSGTLTVTGRSHAAAVRAVLLRFMQWSPEWAYPIDVPADGAGSFSQTWEYWRKYRISDLIKQIEEEGFEVYLRPYMSGENLRWQTVVAPKILIGSSSFMLQAEGTPLSDVGYRLDGSQQLTGGQGLGNGSGQDQIVAWGGGGPYNIPIRDTKRDFPDLAGTRLQASTNAWVAQEREPVGQWSIGSFQISDEWSPVHAAPGRAWKITTKDHPVAPDGSAALRVIKMSGGLGLSLKTEVQDAA